GGAGVLWAGPTETIRLPSTTIMASRSGVGATPSNRVPQRIARILTGPDLSSYARLGRRGPSPATACSAHHRATSIRGRSSRPAPDLAGGLGHQGQLRRLLGLGQEVPLLSRGESTLRAQRQALERDESRRLPDPPLELARALERGALGGDKPQHHRAIVGHVSERLEAAGARVVVFQQKAIEAAPPGDPC